MIALYIVGGIGGGLIALFLGGPNWFAAGFIAGVLIVFLALVWLGNSLGHKWFK